MEKRALFQSLSSNSSHREDDGTEASSPDNRSQNSSVASSTTSITKSTSSIHLPPIKQSSIEELAVERIPYDIDFVGTGSTQVSQHNLFQRRSIEPIKSSDAQLSARGKCHRSLEIFRKDEQNSTAIITQESRKVKREGLLGTPFFVLNPYFQRALASERLNKIDQAIADYTVCITIDPQYAAAYFNRAGLYTMQGNPNAALADLGKAIQLDPTNMSFRANKALVLRSTGSFIGAIEETMIYRAVEMNPSLKRELKVGKSLNLDSDDLLTLKIEADPILTAMQVSRQMKFVLRKDDFLRTYT